MRRWISLLFIFSAFISMAQTNKYRVINIPVKRNGLPVRDAWLGGFDSPQFSPCDLNQDGITDLFVFDRVGNKVYTYLGNGGATDTMFTYAPQYESLFPADLNNWALIRDYNHDGIPDIFTHWNAFIRVYKGSIVNGLLHFDIVSQHLEYHPNDFDINIFANIQDCPGIVDVNGDGDIDILSYDQFGSTIGYYENQYAENPGNPAFALDSFKYNWVTSCWGNVSQDMQTNSMSLNIDTVGNCQYGNGLLGPTSGNERHSGNSVYAFTDPVYHAIDILNGNVGYDDLFFLRNNGGHGKYGYMYEWDSIFPPCGHSMLMASYPAAYGVHIANDTMEDILMAPNGYAGYTNATYPSRNVKNVQYYKNTGDTTCWYEYQSDSFLVHHMLDFGSNSKPVFYDFNGDGLLDIIVGNYGYFDSIKTPTPFISRLAYYQNTGTATHPEFTEVTVDLDSFSKYQLLGLSPAFGDLNGDGKPDMLLGDNVGDILYFQNAGNGHLSSFPSMTSSNYFGLSNNSNQTQFSAPFIFDINGDSLPDLVIGNLNGTLNYYWNYGTRQNPQFNKDSVNSNFGNINVTPYGNPTFDGFSQPFIYRDNSGILKLLVGSQNGTVYAYNINADSLRSGSFLLLDSNYLGQSVGENATISAADITGNGKLEYLMGTATGGIMMYSDSIWDSTQLLGIPDLLLPKGQLLIYPNPAKDYFTVSFENTSFINPAILIYNITGQEISAEAKLNNGKIEVETGNLSGGFYVVKVIDSGSNYQGKVLLCK